MTPLFQNSPLLAIIESYGSNPFIFFQT